MILSFIFRRRSVGMGAARLSAGVLGISLFAAIALKAQDSSQEVAEAARQERARKTAQAQIPSQAEMHIYTNEDLQRSRILLEGDSARVAARKQNPALPSAAPAETNALAAIDTPKAAAGESLGAVARRYRREKSERDAKQASRIPSSSHFHLEIPAGALAEVAPRVAPHGASPVVANVVSALPAAVLPPPSAKNGPDGFPSRRDPFSRTGTGVARSGSGVSQRISEMPTVRLPASPTNVVPSPSAMRPSTVNGVSVSAAPESTTRSVARARTLSRPDPGTSLGRETVTIRTGDSLWKLSRRFFGSGARWSEWLASNPGVNDPQRLRPGTRLLVPKSQPRSTVSAKTEIGNDGRTITVRSGDSLWKISVERYGDGARWPCVAQGNPGLHDAEMIYPGQILTIPAACGNAISSLNSIAH
jgi:nucleoid-associated protein YgaU